MKKSIISFIAVMLVIVLIGIAAIMGFSVGDKTIIPSVFDSENGIRRGLDLVGGSSITFEAQLPDGYDSGNLSKDMETAQEMLRERLTREGFTEASVTLQGDKRLVVEIPNIKNPEDAVKILGATAQLTFTDADGKVWLNGSDVKEAKAQYGRISESSVKEEHYVQMTLTADGQKKFADATQAISSRTDGQNWMAINLDGVAQSQPGVHERIDSDSCIIYGSFNADSAKSLANLINVGQLPFTLDQVELRAVGPQLGSNALRSSFVAALIGIALVAIFMIIIYRLPGFISVIALGFYMVIEAVILSLLKVNLSLPGIAGIILSIGMAVDANVVIFERVKEELRAGKSVKASIDSGFKRAFTAIFDSNITTLIAAAVLFWKGTGTIVGFATTLGLGVIISMFTALTVTHFLLNRMVDFRIKNPKVYGA
ncbi:protein translocase subunit SecD [Intestinibacillus massiliensis]|uniref:protein translocase subunit SecD n=1 Tax=Intestinibacillus massiliensis TaxID=1871029 RepID=UPI000B35B98E|nr:protein translocase subunit SecD [Intestinibacillus massiliensis]MCB6364672.1 protein translocase subunit SecD [Intestinibacillus massiliensis]